ncbi:formate dehydrogenase accessory sulfurtransferase FdhD [Shewanella sp. SR43-4]|jgi:FdhD protein|uniref:Sulfur carrier protein FdhD n=1 Tax=Shewanella vesiculosa TaxID=518738 RepID=A0ABV0FXC7_9GAMM|nr:MULTISPECIES: formate dehydrogenase accessory sulfurtransferase FdhD [Shewanella]NCQ46542.1 formate dehydrogenase accessory sulfurtransferase FdhD [Shewanella frigidimarina]MBB1319292.1 formate dehydrogenase accessory sulfurtransferase FdhD [Shewanella sp. SR43-4]MBB1389992.1 formate dehydrogenase accessory sulfurtransferase FdhD [Shewanella sp. SG44-6]MBB1477487.1 formate dehydrogenase accessory sulfurtransferase FdhD [Shewanella sp. SG41-3]NCO72774.1 formate dehydrogenase accessory sulfur|tara:strand:+ start:2333 stop:3187 length:855 start_codon:yes stop_codon:yes gene_type:complete
MTQSVSATSLTRDAIKFVKTNTQVPLTIAVKAVNEQGVIVDKFVACERPLTVYLNWRPIVTLMTLGAKPESLTLGYLKNQGFISDLSLLESVIVDWDVSSAAVITKEVSEDIEQKLAEKTVTSGCGQGTVYGGFLQGLDDISLPTPSLTQSTIYHLLSNISAYNETYKNAGAVHGCGICQDEKILAFVEDVGRHNAVDTLAGDMWLDQQSGHDKIFYTTGRLTSEMVIKVAKMGIPVLLSRSGVTQMGLDLAKQMGITLIARAKGRHFLVYHGCETITFDAIKD